MDVRMRLFRHSNHFDVYLCVRLMCPHHRNISDILLDNRHSTWIPVALSFAFSAQPLRMQILHQAIHSECNGQIGPGQYGPAVPRTIGQPNKSV